jgi:TonB family protein
MSDGTVISAEVISSSGDEIFDRSVENAVEKSSPLPVPNDKELFAEEFRTFQFLFNPSTSIAKTTQRENKNTVSSNQGPLSKEDAAWLAAYDKQNPPIAKTTQRENISKHLEVSSTKSSFLERDQATGGLTYIASSVIFGLVVFYVLTKGLKGKEKDSATNLGRWYGSTTTMLYLCSGGAKLTKLIHDPGGWFALTLMLSVVWFGIGYIAGLIKWHWSNKSKQKPKDPPPYNDSTGRYKDEHTSQNESHDHYKNRANAKKGHSFEERLDALRNNVDLCFAILDLNNMASPSEIKAAFKKKMSGYHPDKVSGLGDKLKQVAEEETKLINIAYNILKKLGYTK